MLVMFGSGEGDDSVSIAVKFTGTVALRAAVVPAATGVQIRHQTTVKVTIHNARMQPVEQAAGPELACIGDPRHAVAMDLDRVDEAVSPGEQAAAVERYQTDLRRLHEPHQHGNTTVRSASYRGHSIRVVTSYDIEVDCLPVTGHLLVTNEGTVHYHAIPNQEFASAVDMVKRMIDLAPEQFPEPAPMGNHGDHHGQPDTV